MSTTKKTSKKDEEKLLELERQQEMEKKEQERLVKQARLKELAQKSAPLLDYGLLDSYQFFLSQLASSGIPQGNIYQFAAQTILKFEKNKLKKEQKLKQVQKANQQAVKIVSESHRSKSKPRIQRQLKPQILPFKGQLSPKQMQIMGIK